MPKRKRKALGREPKVYEPAFHRLPDEDQARIWDKAVVDYFRKMRMSKNRARAQGHCCDCTKRIDRLERTMEAILRGLTDEAPGSSLSPDHSRTKDA